MTGDGSRPALSVVVVTYDMTRELPRTLRSLSVPYQRDITAEENITLPLDIARQRVDQDYFDEVVDAVGLRDRLDHRPGELSGGQQQRACIARALVTNPDIILADEPTGNLDSVSTHDVLRLLHELHEQGRTIILITHEHDVALESQRQVQIYDGLLSEGLHV